ncbi:hypothetical protein [Brevundimonas sp.]|uniref:hypothetical protein n=1 Tax=Brevundimonas sp. TaxID=1871086 RepID=UPI0035B4DE98
MSPSHRLQGYRAYGRAADAFDTVAWRPPATPRFDHRPANDTGWTAPQPSKGTRRTETPGWAVVVFGGLFAALAGALMGGMLQV